MYVVRIRRVRMFVDNRLVPVRMTVGANRHGIMGVKVMSVVVCMSVLVFLRIVAMRMGVSFRQVQHDASDHEERTGQQKR
jgi:hypothetical protein